MKKALVIALVVACAQGAFAQGTVNFVNNVTGVFKSLIYDANPAAPTVQQKGQSASDVPAGSTVYGGSTLAGTGFTVQLWWADGNVTDASSLTLAQAGTSVFRTGGAAGIWTGTTAVLPGQPGGAGTHVTAEVRVWDNAGGTILDWASAQQRASKLGTSGLFGIDNIGGGTATTPNMVNLQSFSLVAVPEPSTIALALAGGFGLLFLRRRNK